MVIPAWEMVARLGAGVVFGSVVGYERERSGHAAGLRTHLLVALASDLFMLVSTQFTYFQTYTDKDLIAVDTSRIAASVVTGVGFLGGGAIMRTGMGVQGLTTAASLWLVAALGLAAGGGMYLEAVAALGFALFGLIILRRVEDREAHLLRRRLEIVGGPDGPSRRSLFEQLRNLGASLTEVDYESVRDETQWKVQLDVRFRSEEVFERVLALLETLPGVRRVRVELYPT